MAKEGTALPGHVARKHRPQLEPACHGRSALGEALNPGSRELGMVQAFLTQVTEEAGDSSTCG